MSGSQEDTRRVNALANVVEFKVPKRPPKIIEKQAPPDQRSLAVVPLRAIRDRNITDSQLRCLAAICSYCNRAGITWVGQDRIGKDLGVSKQSISKQVKRLVELGYLEVVSKGFRGERANTTRVIFDPEIKTEDAIAVTSGQEDNRPPDMAKREIKEMMEPEFSEEQMAANRERLRKLLGGVADRDGSYHFNKPQRLGDIMAARKPRRKTESHSQPNTVDNEKGSHSQLHSQPNGVDQTQKNIGLDEVISLYEEIIKRRFMVSVKTTEDDLKAAGILCEVGVTASDVDAALAEQRNLVAIADYILNARVSR